MKTQQLSSRLKPPEVDADSNGAQILPSMGVQPVEGAVLRTVFQSPIVQMSSEISINISLTTYYDLLVQ